MRAAMNANRALRKSFALKSVPTDTAGLFEARSSSALPSEIWRWSATDLAAAIQRRDVSSKEAVQATAKRARQVNGRLTAVVDDHCDEALETAKALDAALTAGTAQSSPIFGVPVSIKDNTDQHTKRTVNGLFATADVAARQSPIVENLTASGAVLFGRTNTPCLSSRWECNNAIYGQTHNPWSRQRTPGGSTGGGAAAVAAGIGAIAQGNDVGGSIRYPAYCCGIAGLRPSRGRVPMYNATQFYRGHCNQMFNVEGLLARDVRDLAAALPVIARGHVDDPWWVGRPEHPVEPVSQARIGLIVENADTPTDPRILAEVRAVGAALEDMGFEVEEITPPSIAQAMDLWSSMVFGELRFGWEQFAAIADAKAVRANELFLGVTEEISVQKYLEGTSRVLDIRREWARFMSTYPILVAPTSCDLPYKLDFDLESVEETRRQLYAQAYLPTVNLLGLPSVALPTKLVDVPDAPKGLPIGVQIIGQLHCDELALSVAALLQQDRFAPFGAVDPV